MFAVLMRLENLHQSLLRQLEIAENVKTTKTVANCLYNMRKDLKELSREIDYMREVLNKV